MAQWDTRPVRRVSANEHAPTGEEPWPADVPAVRQVLDEELELVRHWRDYLAEPMRYLRHVLD